MCQEEELIILYTERQAIIENKNMNRQNTQEEQNFIQQMQNQGEFKITPCSAYIDLDDKSRFEKMKLTSEYKMQINALQQ